MTTRLLPRRRYRLVPALLLAVVAGCAAGRRQGGNASPAATIAFTNESLYQAAVYIAAPGAGTRRIGTVFAGRTETLVVPRDIASRGGTVNIVARLINSSPQTGPVSIQPGGRYAVRVTTDSRVLSFLPAQ